MNVIVFKKYINNVYFHSNMLSLINIESHKNEFLNLIRF